MKIKRKLLETAVFIVFIGIITSIIVLVDGHNIDKSNRLCGDKSYSHSPLYLDGELEGYRCCERIADKRINSSTGSYYYVREPCFFVNVSEVER